MSQYINCGLKEYLENTTGLLANESTQRPRRYSLALGVFGAIYLALPVWGINVQGNTVLRLACSARSIGPCLFGAYITSKARIQSCAWRDENAPPTSANVSGEPITGREYGALKREPITGRVIGAVCLSERVYKSSSRSAVRVLHSRPQSRGGRAGRDGAPTNHTLSRSPRSVYAGRLCVWRVVNGISLAISIIFIWFSTFITLH